MPCIIKLKIIGARNLPVMDRATELTDAFVEVRYADFDPLRTQICRRTLNPVWNEDFRFEVSDDADLQNFPLELKVMDYDQITYNDAIGTVFIDLNPLLSWDSQQQSGYLPIFDTLRGVRGELNAQIKLQFFGDINRFSDSSAGVQFFSVPRPPPSYHLVAVLGFVFALEVEDDPEYHWVDNFRTPRTSNDARTRTMFQLSGRLRRQLGKKVLELNGNAVIGYKQYFDLESEQRTITARAIGTAIRLALPDQIDPDQPWVTASPGIITVHSQSEAHLNLVAASDRRSTDDGSFEDRKDPPSPPAEMLPKPALVLNANFRSLEQHPLTLPTFPTGSILGIGGLVAASSVKIIENDSKDIREGWWNELRDEVKAHAKTLGCPLIVGYSESLTIRDDLAVLSCYGTAAIVDLGYFLSVGGSSSPNHVDREKGKGASVSASEEVLNSKEELLESRHDSTVMKPMQRPSINSSSFKEGTFLESFAKRKRRRKRSPGCQACHITYSKAASPYPMAFTKCQQCGKKYVPEVLLTTIEPPQELATIGKGVMIEGYVCRQKKSRAGENQATIVSETLPFVQYDIHRQLMFKLKTYGLNAVFGLKIQFSVGDNLILAVATGTALYVRALPPPPALKLFRNIEILDDEDKRLMEIQRVITNQAEVNRKQIESALAQNSNSLTSLDRVKRRGSHSVKKDKPADSGDIQNDDAATKPENEVADSESSISSDSDGEGEQYNRQNSVVVQIDDEHDEDLVLLLDPSFPDDFQLRNIETSSKSDLTAPSSNVGIVSMITMIKQGHISIVSRHPNRQLATLFKKTYQELQVQLHHVKPCIVARIDHEIQLLKSNELQIRLTACVLGRVRRIDDQTLSRTSVMASTDDRDDQDIELDLPATPSRTENGSSKSIIQSPSSTIAPTPLVSARQVTVMSLATEATDEHASRKSLDSSEADMVFPMDADSDDENFSVATPQIANPQQIPMPMNIASSAAATPSRIPQPSPSQFVSLVEGIIPHTALPQIEITPFSYIPNGKIEKFLGRISLHFVKEASILLEPTSTLGGIGGFSHVFLSELYAIVRAYTASLGGNALLEFSVDQSYLVESIKNQGYCLLSVSGDVVQVCMETRKYEMPFSRIV